MGGCQSRERKQDINSDQGSRPSSRPYTLQQQPPLPLTGPRHGRLDDRWNQPPTRPLLDREIEPAQPNGVQSPPGNVQQPRPVVHLGEDDRSYRIQERRERERLAKYRIYMAKYVSKIDGILETRPADREPIAKRSMKASLRYKRAEQAQIEWTNYQTLWEREKLRVQDLLKNGDVMTHSEADRKIMQADCEEIQAQLNTANDAVRMWTQRHRRIESELEDESDESDESESEPSITTLKANPERVRHLKPWQKGYYDNPNDVKSYIKPAVFQTPVEGGKRDDIDYDGQDDTGTVPGYMGYGKKPAEQAPTPKVFIQEALPPVTAAPVVEGLGKEKSKKRADPIVALSPVTAVVDPVVAKSATPAVIPSIITDPPADFQDQSIHLDSPLVSPVVSPDLSLPPLPVTPPSTEKGESSTNSKIPIPTPERSNKSELDGEAVSVSGDNPIPKNTRKKGAASRGRGGKRGGRGGSAA